MNTQKIQAILDNHIKKGRSPGISIAFYDGRQDYFFNEGVADLVNKKKVNENTYFEIGSITKTVTALVIEILRARELINFEDKISLFFPEFLGSNSENIRIIELLTHTSGLASVPDNIPDTLKNPYKNYTNEMTLNWVKDHNLDKGKIGKFIYSNLGYALLTGIIEKVSQKEYFDFINENILIPLNLDFIHVHTKETLTNGSIGHTSGLLETPYWEKMNWFSGAGSLKSNSSGLLNYLKYQLNPPNTFLGECILNTQKTHLNDKDSIGNYDICLGWTSFAKEGHKTFCHGGATGGHVAQVYFYPEINSGFVALFNSHSYIEGIEKLFLGLDFTGNDNELFFEEDPIKYLGKFVYKKDPEKAKFEVKYNSEYKFLYLEYLEHCHYRLELCDGQKFNLLIEPKYFYEFQNLKDGLFQNINLSGGELGELLCDRVDEF